MTDHRDESLIDKVKDAFGMGDRDDDATVGDRDAGLGAGIGGTGSEYGAGVGGTGGIGGTAEDSGVDGEDRTTLTGAGTSEWSRGEAASGQSPFEGDEDALGSDRENRGI